MNKNVLHTAKGQEKESHIKFTLFYRGDSEQENTIYCICTLPRPFRETIYLNFAAEANNTADSLICLLENHSRILVNQPLVARRITYLDVHNPYFILLKCIVYFHICI